MTTHRSRRATPPAAIVVIPAVLGVFTMLTVILTIRVVGFAVLAGLGVFLVSFALSLLLDLLVLRRPR